MSSPCNLIPRAGWGKPEVQFTIAKAKPFDNLQMTSKGGVLVSTDCWSYRSHAAEAWLAALNPLGKTNKRQLQRRTGSRGLTCRDARFPTPAKGARDDSRLADGGVTAPKVTSLRGYSVLQGAPVRAAGAKVKAVLSM